MFFEPLKQVEVGSSITDGCELDAMGRSPKERFAPNNGDHASREEILGLVRRVFFSPDGSAPRLVVFCGVDAESGSSSVCARVGRALATESSGPVCIVDANVRSASLSGIIGVDTATAFFDKTSTVREGYEQIGGNLWFAGPDTLADDRGALPSVDELKLRLTQLRGGFEYVLIDTPGTSVSGNAAILGRVADAAILVIEANRTRRLTARKAKENLDAAGVRLLGTVLYNRVFPIPDQLYRRL
jgi:Mrp family chromosome partitioning ATPase